MIIFSIAINELILLLKFNFFRNTIKLIMHIHINNVIL